jgi:SAM-dependent methyltransferase
VVDFVGHGSGTLIAPPVVQRQARNEMAANLAALTQHLEQSATNTSGPSSVTLEKSGDIVLRPGATVEPAMADGPANYASVDFISPMSWDRARRLAARLARDAPAVVVDIGCGLGELLIQVVELTHTGVGVGIDIDETVLERGRSNAAAKGLDHRIRFITGLADADIAQSDVVICCGASQAFGTPPEALVALFDLVSPGGTVLFADGFWDGTAPPGDGSATAGMTELPDLAGLVNQAISAGFRPLWIETATRAEWEEFESGYLADWENWLVANPQDPRAAAIREKADTHRNRWLNGYYHGYGYAYLTLGRPLDT